MPEIVLACRDCRQIHRASAGLLQRRWLLCCRCGARLWQLTSSEFAVPLAFAVTAAILFVLANTLPLFDISLAGNGRSALILNGAVALSEYGDSISVVGMLVAMTSGIIPALSIAGRWRRREPRGRRCGRRLHCRRQEDAHLGLRAESAQPPVMY
jgi:paraquat-inducible protein A